MTKVNLDKKLRRKRSISLGIKGTGTVPRISVFRSNRYIYAQAIDDQKKTTLACFSSLNLRKGEKDVKIKKTEEAKEIGKSLAGILKEKKISQCLFDRNIYIYKGRVKNLAEGLREGGIKV